MKPQYVIVAGYVWTGSSALVDLLKEYKGAWESNVEFRLIKDSYGLTDLRYNIVENWDPLNVDNAIKDFIWLTKTLNQKKSIVSSGLGYGSQEVFGNKFNIATNIFINKICDFRYEGTWWMTDFKCSKLQLLTKKIRRKLKLTKKEYMYYSSCNEKEFDEAVREYLNELFLIGKNQDNDRFAILDQALPAQNPYLLNKFFENSKMIIVDRDPRDVYVETLNGEMLIGPEIKKTRNVEIFLKWHEQYHKNVNFIGKNSNIMKLNFEDLVLNYDNTINEIEKFLDFTPQDHISKFKFFNPEISEKNIGKWKTHDHLEEIYLLQEKLSEYLWFQT